ncbi:MAG: hypothetical protein H6842_00850 [Rhodospirillaceae bacterium]|nr:hypothetical protein [Rhodospirillaceae bacterium]
MKDECAYLAGQVAEWPAKVRLAEILVEAGLRVQVGRYSVRVLNCEHFVFQELGGDRGDPQIEADALSVDELLRDGRLVSAALAAAGLRHRFEIYRGDEMAGYLHHDWPAG